MIISSIGSSFSGNSGSSQGANGSSNQSDPASEDTSTSGSTPSDGTGSSAATGSSNASSGSSSGQTGGQSTASNTSSQSAASNNDASTQPTVLVDETPDAPSDVNALRNQALTVQKQLNTEMLIKSLGATVEADTTLLSEPESDVAVPLAVAAYAENFLPSAEEIGTKAA